MFCPLLLLQYIFLYFFFFFNDTATTEIYTLSLHDALPISCLSANKCVRIRHIGATGQEACPTYGRPVIRRSNRSSAICAAKVRTRWRSPRNCLCTAVVPAASARPTYMVPFGTFSLPASGPAAPVMDSA